MKKLLLLGGSFQQIIAIKKAKEMGFYTILCDYLPDNPGQYEADKFYCVSTTNPEAILEVAVLEKIDGIIAYASDPAAPTAAFVAEKMGLHGNPLKSVEILCNKNLLREFLSSNGFCVPKSFSFDSKEAALAENNVKMLSEAFAGDAFIIKPVDSSGSKGVTVLQNFENYNEAIANAFSFSRSGKIIVETFVEKNHPYLVGGDIVVKNGKIVLWGLLNCHRDKRVNSLVPVGKSYPLSLSDYYVELIKNTLTRLINILEIKDGPLNVELVVDKNDRPYILDIGPRAGGNMIPELLDYIFGTDIVAYSVASAVLGDAANFDGKFSENTEILPPDNVFFATHNIHAAKSGRLEAIKFSPEIEKFIFRKCLYVAPGDNVEYFDYSSKALGIVFMRFETKAQMQKILQNINNHIVVSVCEGEIGGYFGLEEMPFQKGDLPYPGSYWPDSARNALVLLARARNYRKIYIPEYLCESVKNVLARENIEYEFYDVGEDLRPVFDKTLGNFEALYIVNYFGQLKNSEIKAYKERFASIIVDNVQSFFTPPVANVDTIYSCRKFFGVPDGAYLETNAEIEPVGYKNCSLADVPYLEGRLKDGATAHYSEFKAHDSQFAENEPTTASLLSIGILSRIDYAEVFERRNNNYEVLAKALDKLNYLVTGPAKLTQPAGAYCYPFYVEDAEKAKTLRQKLIENKVYVPVLWPNCENLEFTAHILPLPCDQRYGAFEMEKVAEIILENI